MAEVTARDYPFVREEVDRAEANRRFADDPLKLERISDLGDDETISVYTDGPFVDLCRGPHVPEHRPAQALQAAVTPPAPTGGATRAARCCSASTAPPGSRRTSSRPTLHRLEEARKRDHRKLGKELDLFMFHPFAPGRGLLDRAGHDALQHCSTSYMRELQRDGYQEIKTPLLYNKGLWEISGHWGKYRENMFLVLDNETGEHDMLAQADELPVAPPAVRRRRSTRYRELPIRYSTYDVLHRNEVTRRAVGPDPGAPVPAGRLPHLPDASRRSPTRCSGSTEFILGYYADVRARRRRSSSPPGPEQRIGDDAMWDRAEGALRAALEATGLPYELKPGDGAFYGPKIDFDVADSIGRKWQLGHDPARLRRAGAVRPQLRRRGQPRAPAGGDPPRGERLVRAVHRDPDRALRRRVPGLARAGAGAGAADLRSRRPRRRARSTDRLRAAGIRATLDDRHETLNYRIREGEVAKVPVHGGGGAARGRQRQPGAPGARGGQEAGSADGGRVPRARHRGSAHAGPGTVGLSATAEPVTHAAPTRGHSSA